MPERLTEAVIPLSKREGKHWRLLESLITTIRESEVYRKTEAKLYELTEVALHKLRTNQNYIKLEAKIIEIWERMLKSGGENS